MCKWMMTIGFDMGKVLIPMHNGQVACVVTMALQLVESQSNLTQYDMFMRILFFLQLFMIMMYVSYPASLPNTILHNNHNVFSGIWKMFKMCLHK